jgi:4'-phosphopantetheinyl transferase EntD
MIEEILPGEVVSVDTRADPPDAVLFPEEEARLARAVEKRRREFTTARVCARRAMAILGLPPAPVLPGPHGEPLWPAGVVGSMTHCAGYRGAALARAAEVITIGIDTEPHDVLPDGVLRHIATPDEETWVPELMRTHPEVCWDRLLFSAKESVYKAWFPLAQRWLGFEDATVTVDPIAGTFQAQLLVPGPAVAGRALAGFSGRWLVLDGLVLTAIALVVPSP